MKKTIILSLWLLAGLCLPVTGTPTDISQLANAVYIESSVATAGSQHVLTVKMKNAASIQIQSFQFDMYLPGGVSLVTDGYGKPGGVALSTGRTTASGADYFGCALQGDGALRVLCTRGSTFSGTDGAVATVTVDVDGNLEPGDYPLVLENIVMADHHVHGYDTDRVETVLTVKAPAVTLTIPAAGICTFSNENALDFSATTGFKAYIASGFNPLNGDLLLTRVSETPAGEGLLLKGTPGSYEVPIVGTGMYYSNLLVGVTTATTVSPTEGGYTNFILSNGSYGIGFYTMSQAGEIAAGKAYLQLPSAIVGSARMVNIVFDDEVTGITTAERTGDTGGDCYDLQGRRVEHPAKGLYIVNGTKVVKK